MNNIQKLSNVLQERIELIKTINDMGAQIEELTKKRSEIIVDLENASESAKVLLAAMGIDAKILPQADQIEEKEFRMVQGHKVSIGDVLCFSKMNNNSNNLLGAFHGEVVELTNDESAPIKVRVVHVNGYTFHEDIGKHRYPDLNARTFKKHKENA